MARCADSYALKASLAQRNTLEYTPIFCAFMLYLHNHAQATGAPPSGLARCDAATTDRHDFAYNCA